MRQANFEKFMKEIETEKETMYKKSWFVLGLILENKITSREQLEAAKYIINRKDGMPTQNNNNNNTGELTVKIVNYGNNSPT